MLHLQLYATRSGNYRKLFNRSTCFYLIFEFWSVLLFKNYEILCSKNSVKSFFACFYSKRASIQTSASIKEFTVYEISWTMIFDILCLWNFMDHDSGKTNKNSSPRTVTALRCSRLKTGKVPEIKSNVESKKNLWKKFLKGKQYGVNQAFIGRNKNRHIFENR